MTANKALHEVSVNTVKADENTFVLSLSKDCYVYIKDVLTGLEEFNSASLMWRVKVLEALKNVNSWIPITTRPLTQEEQEYYGDEYACMFTCELPEDGDEVLISRANGKWVNCVTFCNDDFFGDEDGNDWVNDVEAWMPLPKGYMRPPCLTKK